MKNYIFKLYSKLTCVKKKISGKIRDTDLTWKLFLCQITKKYLNGVADQSW